MKKIITLLFAVIVVGLFSCKKETPAFADFDYTTAYFPFQYPVRTLVLGDYNFDNTNDNSLKYLISARVGGLYQENKKDWTVGFEIANSLADRLTTSLNDTIEILPARYYTLDRTSDLLIPKGDFYGSVTVQLTDAFLDDPKAYKIHYVLPLRIKSATTDSILVGSPKTPNPDPRVAASWNILPKNFTLFGINFVNKYHGKYLHRGQSVIKNNSGATVETVVYHQPYVEQDEVWSLQTTGRNKVSVTGVLRASAGSPGSYKMDLNFDANGNAVITQTPGSSFTIAGTGTFLKDGDSWGNEKRDVIYLKYQVNQGTNTHTITDTLVFRDKAVVFQEFIPKVY